MAGPSITLSSWLGPLSLLPDTHPLSMRYDPLRGLLKLVVLVDCPRGFLERALTRATAFLLI